MTAEVAIMNKSAIALAADSAVTGDTRSGPKIYDTADKLFRLSKVYPVGIMLYDIATFMDVPWETIIKEYRDYLGERNFDFLEDFCKDFFSFLENHSYFFPEEQQKAFFIRGVFGYLNMIKGELDEVFKEKTEKNEKLTKRKITQTVNEVINKHLSMLQGLQSLDGISNEYKEEVVKKYIDIIEDGIREVLEKIVLNQGQKRKLIEIAGLLFCKNIFPERTSGIVIAGFGKKDIFPKLRSFECESIIRNRIKKYELGRSDIEFNNVSSIIPFAQQDMVHMFMRGIDPKMRSFQDQYLEQIFLKYPDMLVNKIKGLTVKEKKDMKKSILKSSQKLFNDYKDNVENFSQKKYINAVISVVDLLPKEEMARMAETLVNLTLFKQKVSLEIETVGGPIDVAVITKGDGFVWIKRKFYFDKDINPRYLKSSF